MKLNKKNLASRITEKCLEAGIDVMDLLSVLENNYQSHLNTIKP